MFTTEAIQNNVFKVEGKAIDQNTYKTFKQSTYTT